MSILAPPPPPYPAHYVIDPVAFFAALIAAPLLVTLLTAWLLFIPVFALILGGPAYLVVGTPVLLWYLRRNDGDPNDLGFVAFILMLVFLVPICALGVILKEPQLISLGLGYLGFGMIFGPAWAYVFGRLYQKFRRGFFAIPRPL